MKTKIKHIALFSLQAFLIAFWLFVGLEKIWNLKEFHEALLRQPFPNSWADNMYLGLPVLEVGIGALLIFPRTRRLGFLCSVLLLLVFSGYIWGGVNGMYTEVPCGCASVFKSLSWETHLYVNLILAALSLIGWHLSKSTNELIERKPRYKRAIKLFQKFRSFIVQNPLCLIHCAIDSFRRKFAPFPRAWGAHYNFICGISV